MIDDRDKKLLETLRENADLSTYKVSKKTGIPQTTVLNRIRKLKEEGIIKRYTVEVDHKKLGDSVKALIFVKVNKDIEKKKHGKIADIEEKLSNYSEVLCVKRLMGKQDFMIELITKDVDTLNHFLITKVRSLDEVADTETVLVLQEWDGSHYK
ncbi:Lrp/AsnC family transcriptional regulator [Candidatus Woesearchaeota archaeon]|nr:Lrp/AsnC family transcriptional regulator [Candidatus Woesearchaeota archaeon]